VDVQFLYFDLFAEGNFISANSKFSLSQLIYLLTQGKDGKENARVSSKTLYKGREVTFTGIFNYCMTYFRAPISSIVSGV